MKFEEFKLSKQLQEAIKKLGIDKPTEIQEGSIPPILEGRDLIGESATGSGKTLAFGCGILEKVNNKEGLQALVLTPTRELADQVKDMLVRLSQGKYINIIAVYGGVSLNPQFQELARKYMKNPVEVNADNKVDPSKLKQIYYDVERNLKLSLLIHLLQKEKSGLIMVFCNTRKMTDIVVKNLRTQRFDAIAIHGGFSQNKRTNTMDMFNKGKVGVLVCTDVAARGLHIENVSHVYNFNIPNDPNDYVHRIGRTARAGKDGKVVNLLCDYDYDNFSKITHDYREFKIEKIKVPQIERIAMVKVAERRDDRRGGNYSRSGGFGRNRNNSRNFKRR